MKVWCFYNTNEFISHNHHQISTLLVNAMIKKIYDVVVQFEIKMYATKYYRMCIKPWYQLQQRGILFDCLILL